MRTLALLLFGLSLYTLPAQAQLWSGILDRSRATDWTTAGAIITSRTTQCGATIQAYSGSATTINNAIQNCTAGQYVQLGAGTFNLSTGITFSGRNNVTLRGMGPDSTNLKFTGKADCIFQAAICVNGSSSVWGGDVDRRSWETAWTGGFSQGTTQLTVGSTANMAAGRIIVLDQRDDSTNTGGIVNSATKPTFSNEGGPMGRHDTADGGVFRSQQQIVKIVSVNDSTHVTVTPGVRMPNWRSGQSPEVWGWGTTDSSTIQGAGIEDLSIDNTNGSSLYYNIEFSNAYNSWVKNIRSLNSPRAHIGLTQATHITVSDSYFYGTRNGASVSYGIDNFSSSDGLYINNIFHHVVAPLMGPSQGSVWAYNYMIDMTYTSNPAFNTAGIFATHDSGGGMQLYEGNQTNGVVADFPHGNSPLLTFFRNHLDGIDDIGTKTMNRNVFEVRSWARGYNIVGNVLGDPAFHTAYETTGGEAIYKLGIGGSGVPDDALVKSSLLRWGNYDTVGDTARWLSSEVPTTGITYLNGNAVPSSQSLPASFFLSAKPSWWASPWGNPAWPPIGPDVTGGSVPGYGGRVWNIPAKLCYLNSPIDPGYAGGTGRGILKFNAKSCYGNAEVSQPLASPQNFRLLQ